MGEVLGGRKGDCSFGATVANEESPSKEGEDENKNRARDDGYDDDSGGR